MGHDRWTEEEVLELSKDREAVIDRLVRGLSGERDVVFAAKFGYGVPRIDFLTVDPQRNLTGYVLKFPVSEGKLSSIPLYQGFGESIFVADQMFDESYLIFPDILFPEYNPFTLSPNTRYRLKKETYESGVCTFDREFNLKVVKEPKGSLAEHYWRLKLELLDSIINFGVIVVGDGKEEMYGEWKAWAEAELANLGDKKLLDKGSAKKIIEKVLGEKNYHDIKMEIVEGEVESKPRDLPVFNVTGSGFYLGDEKDFSLQMSRISGRILKDDL